MTTEWLLTQGFHELYSSFTGYVLFRMSWSLSPCFLCNSECNIYLFTKRIVTFYAVACLSTSHICFKTRAARIVITFFGAVESHHVLYVSSATTST